MKSGIVVYPPTFSLFQFLVDDWPHNFYRARNPWLLEIEHKSNPWIITVVSTFKHTINILSLSHLGVDVYNSQVIGTYVQPTNNLSVGECYLKV